MAGPEPGPSLTFYTVNEVAHICRLTPYTIRDYLKKGIIKGTKVGRGWRVSAQDLTNYLENKHG